MTSLAFVEVWWVSLQLTKFTRELCKVLQKSKKAFRDLASADVGRDTIKKEKTTLMSVIFRN